MESTPYTLSESTGAQSVKLLNKNPVGVMHLYAPATQPHWNVRGRGLIALHELENYCDLIVGRAVPLGGVVAQMHWFAVSGALAAFGQSLREAIGLATSSGEVDTADLVFRNLSGRRPATVFRRISLCAEKLKKPPCPQALSQDRGDGSELACSIVRISGRFFAFVGRSRAGSKLKDCIAIWANEGGAGGDVNR